MPRPKKIDSKREIEKRDTMTWCFLIKAQSGLTGIEIEERLEPAGLTKRELEERRAGKNYVPPTGRNFNRWLSGERAMNHDSLQLFVKNAREVGLLPRRKMLGSHVDGALEARAGAGKSSRASDDLQQVLKSIRELHAAKRALSRAAALFQNAVIAAEKHGVDIFDTIIDTPGACPDSLLEGTNACEISNRIGEIASWYFFEGLTHSLK